MANPSRVGAAGPAPLLSICMVARNDQFHGDYRYRLSTCLNFLAKGLASIGRAKDVEVIVADWGSDVPLHKELVLLPPARELVRFLVIPPDLARERQGDADFGYAIGLNAALRRASGEFAAELSADVILTTPCLHTLVAILDGTYPGIPVRESFMPILRRQLPMCQAERRLSVRELDEYLTLNLALLLPDAMGCGYGGASGRVLHRSLWEASRGYNETMLHGGWADVDFALRITQRYPNIELANFGICGAHLQHHLQTPNDPTFLAGKKNPPDDAPDFVANDENWGLGDQALEFHQLEQVSDELPADETSRVGTTESWNLTGRQVVEQLTNRELFQQVQAVLQAVRIEPQELAPAPGEINAFLGVAWHAQRRGVRTYVETGMKVPYGACLVARNSPGVELYTVVDWAHPQNDGGSLELLANNLLKGLGQHWGYLRFVGDDPATAVERIRKSTPGRFAVDLVLLRSGPKHPAAARQALELAGCLRPGGAIVVAGADEPSFRSVWSVLSAQYPQLTYLRFADRRSGIALAATLAG
jgi:hypothetical protein